MLLDELNKEIKILPYKGMKPKIDESVFLASGSKVIGDVEIGENSSVWYNSVLRGDVNYIKIGKYSNIQDLSMCHVTNGKYPLNVGDNVTVGHSVTLHGCTIEDNCLIGMGAVILDNAIVRKNSLVAAGSVVKPNFEVPSGKLVAGIPAKVVRDLTEAEIQDIADSAVRYYKYTLETIESFKNE